MRLLPFEYAVRNLGRSHMRLALSLSGAALVALLALAATAFVVGMQRSLSVSASPNNVLLLGAGSEESLERSQIDSRVATIAAASLTGVRTTFGIPHVSPEIHMALAIKIDRAEPKGRLGVIRGFKPEAFLVHPQVHIVEGRAPEPGRDEVMVGTMVMSKLEASEAETALNAQLWIDDRPWTIVGKFEAPQTVMDAELWMPLIDLQIVTQRNSNLSCVVVGLDPTKPGGDPADVEVFAFMRSDLELSAITETEYYKKLSAFFAPVRSMTMLTAGLIGLGAALGGLNTMYAAFASRVREIATLQTLGFSRRAIALSLVQESTITGAAGALLACGAGYFLLDGFSIRFSMGVFGLVVDSVAITAGILAGVGLGMFGALPPTIRCLRMPITQALRSG